MLDSGYWLPVAFMGVMGLSVLAYVVLDGFDLGVGMLASLASPAERDPMVSAIGPFWDANETWLVLGVGILLVAFPRAHGMVLGALYLPVAVMLGGLILRGVAFEFRAKAGTAHKLSWDRAFIAGSLLTSLAQGYMLGQYILGFEGGLGAELFSILVGVCVVAAYAFIGAAWLTLKTEGALQRQSIAWARSFLWLTALGALAISLATPLVSERVFDRWLGSPVTLLLAPVPLLTVWLFTVAWRALRRLGAGDASGAWVPFTAATGIFALCFLGLAYSFWPYVVPERLTMWDAASAPESLALIFAGTMVVLPIVIGYTVYLYRVFRGKARALSYE